MQLFAKQLTWNWNSVTGFEITTSTNSGTQISKSKIRTCPEPLLYERRWYCGGKTPRILHIDTTCMSASHFEFEKPQGEEARRTPESVLTGHRDQFLSLSEIKSVRAAKNQSLFCCSFRETPNFTRRTDEVKMKLRTRLCLRCKTGEKKENWSTHGTCGTGLDFYWRNPD